MKIVYLLASDGAWGGLEKHVFELAGAMAARGHDVIVLAVGNYAARCPAHVTLQAFDCSGSRWNPLLWWRLRQTLKAIAPDVVHAHAAKAVAILARSGWPHGTRAIGTAHNLKSGYRDYRKLDAVIAVSRSITQGIQHPHVSVVHNGIPTTPVRPEKLQAIQQWLSDKPHPLILAIGRLVPAKGFDLLLQAWPQEAAATLVILGGGPEADNLHHILEQRRLQNVHLLGESDAVQEWLACANLLVISSHNEGGPYVMAEALLAGVPVISTDVGMIKEFLAPECVVQDTAVAPLKDRIETALQDMPQLRRTSQHAMQAAGEQLTLDAMARNTESVYLQTLQR